MATHYVEVIPFFSRPLSMTDVYSVMDVGAEKICCLIAAREPGQRLTVIGSGRTRSEGFDNGNAIDMYALPTAILKAVRRAEEMADVRITEQGFSELRFGNPSDDDTGTSRIVHALPVSYELDGSRENDPADMVGNLLRINAHPVLAERSVGWNLETCLVDAQIKVKAWVSSALAAGKEPRREFLSQALPSRAGGLRAAFRWLRENF